MAEDEVDRPIRRARLVALLSLVPAPLTTGIMAGIALGRDSDPTRLVLGGIGIAAVVISQSIALYRSLSDDERAESGRRVRFSDLLFGLIVLVSIPLVAPVGTGSWATWAWLGGSVAGSLPLLYRRPAVLITSWVALFVVVIAVGTWFGDPLRYGLTAASIGLTVAIMCGLPIMLWRLVGELRAGRDARARLAVAEERLRFARDIHDLVGHTLSVIALKAELVERLQPADPERAAAEAGQLRRLTSDALVQLRSTVDGYRGMDLEQQLAAVREALDSAGISYRIDLSTRPGSAAVSRLLAIAVREATTNVLRHAGSGSCVITLDRFDDRLQLRVINEVCQPTPPAGSRPGTGLAGMRERFAEFGGTVRAGREGDRFVFEATLPSEAP